MWAGQGTFLQVCIARKAGDKHWRPPTVVAAAASPSAADLKRAAERRAQEEQLRAERAEREKWQRNLAGIARTSSRSVDDCAVPAWPYSRCWGHYASGTLTFIILGLQEVARRRLETHELVGCTGIHCATANVRFSSLLTDRTDQIRIAMARF